MESRVLTLEEKILEVGEKQMVLQTTMDSVFNDSTRKIGELASEMQPVKVQINLILSRLDVMMTEKGSTLTE